MNAGKTDNHHHHHQQYQRARLYAIATISALVDAFQIFYAVLTYFFIKFIFLLGRVIVKASSSNRQEVRKQPICNVIYNTMRIASFAIILLCRFLLYAQYSKCRSEQAIFRFSTCFLRPSVEKLKAKKKLTLFQLNGRQTVFPSNRREKKHPFSSKFQLAGLERKIGERSIAKYFEWLVRSVKQDRN